MSVPDQSRPVETAASPAMSAVPPNAEVNSEVDGLLDQVIWLSSPVCKNISVFF